MKIIYILVIISCIYSCKKDNTLNTFPIGIYVEETLRLDTIDFTVNNTKDASIFCFNFAQQPDLTMPPLPTPGYTNGLYNFIIKPNTTIDLRSVLSSSTNFQNYYFNWQQSATSFEIDKFYIRNNIPTRLRFIKL